MRDINRVLNTISLNEKIINDQNDEFEKLIANYPEDQKDLLRQQKREQEAFAYPNTSNLDLSGLQPQKPQLDPSKPDYTGPVMYAPTDQEKVIGRAMATAQSLRKAQETGTIPAGTFDKQLKDLPFTDGNLIARLGRNAPAEDLQTKLQDQLQTQRKAAIQSGASQEQIAAMFPKSQEELAQEMQGAAFDTLAAFAAAAGTKGQLPQVRTGDAQTASLNPYVGSSHSQVTSRGFDQSKILNDRPMSKRTIGGWSTRTIAGKAAAAILAAHTAAGGLGAPVENIPQRVVQTTAEIQPVELPAERRSSSGQSIMPGAAAKPVAAGIEFAKDTFRGARDGPVGNAIFGGSNTVRQNPPGIPQAGPAYHVNEPVVGLIPTVHKALGLPSRNRTGTEVDRENFRQIMKQQEAEKQRQGKAKANERGIKAAAEKAVDQAKTGWDIPAKTAEVQAAPAEAGIPTINTVSTVKNRSGEKVQVYKKDPTKIDWSKAIGGNFGQEVGRAAGEQMAMFPADFNTNIDTTATDNKSTPISRAVMAGSSAETAVPATTTVNPMDNAARQTGTATATSNTTQTSNTNAASTAPSTASASSNAASASSNAASASSNAASASSNAASNALGRAVGTHNLMSVIRNLLNTQNTQQQKTQNPAKTRRSNTSPKVQQKGGPGVPVPPVGETEDSPAMSYPDSLTNYQSHSVDPFSIKIKSNLMQGFNAGEHSSSGTYDRADNPTGYYGQLLFGARGKPRDPRFQW